MRALRVFVGVVMLALSFVGGAAAGAALGFRLREYSPPADVAPAHLQLLDWIGWPQLALLAAAVVLYFVTALKLFRRVKTHYWHLAGFVAHAALWAWAWKLGPLVAARPDGVPVDVYALAASAAAGVAIIAMARTHLD